MCQKISETLASLNTQIKDSPIKFVVFFMLLTFICVLIYNMYLLSSIETKLNEFKTPYIYELKLLHEEFKKGDLSEDIVQKLEILNAIHEKKLTHIYEIQVTALNRWLSILAIFLTFMAIIVPVIFTISLSKRDKEFQNMKNDFELKMNDFEAVKNKSQELQNQTQVDRYVSSALIEINKNDYEAAKNIAGDIFAIDPKNPHAFYILGLSYYNEKLYPSCVSVCKRGLKYNKVDYSLNTLLGRSLLHIDLIDEASEILNEINKFSINVPSFIEEFSIHFAKKGYHQKALALLDKYENSYTDKQLFFRGKIKVNLIAKNFEDACYNFINCYAIMANDKQKNDLIKEIFLDVPTEILADFLNCNSILDKCKEKYEFKIDNVDSYYNDIKENINNEIHKRTINNTYNL